jgi:hypothetical protein
MRFILYATIIAALAPVMFYGCDRAARASTMVIWELVYDGNVLSSEIGDLTYAECAHLKAELGGIDLQCIPRQVQREES